GVPDQIVAPPSRTSATAQDGPIMAWERNGHSYRASIVRAAWASAASTSPTSAITRRRRAGIVRMVRYRSAIAGQETSEADHVTLRFRAAWMASHSVSATTPRKFPFLTTLTDPGRTRAPSAARSLAPGGAGRITRPCSMSGTRTSTMYVKRPVALSGMSIRGTGWPTIVYWSGDFG